MSKHWYLVQTKPKQEFTAEDNVKNQGFEVYLPKFTLDNRDKPLFPGYAFVRLADNINWSPLFSTKGVARFVRFGSDFAIVPKSVINLIMKKEKDAGNKAIKMSKFEKGDKLTIISGPLKGFNVEFEHYTADERIAILFNMLHQQQKTTVEKSQVVKNIEDRYLIRPIETY